MPELSDQIRTYYEATTEPVDLDTIHHHDATQTEVIMLDSNRNRRPTRPSLLVVAAAVAAVALVAGLIVATRGSDEQLPSDEPQPSLPETEAIPAPVEADALPGSFNPVAAGRYATSALAIDLEFEVPRDMQVLSVRSSAVALAVGVDGELSMPPLSADWTPENVVQVSLIRIDGWSTRDEAINAADVGSIDPDDLDAWVADNDLTILRDGLIEIDGRSARVVDVEVDPETAVRAGSCAEAYQPCFFAAAVAGDEDATRSRTLWMSAAARHRIYLIPIEGSVPLAIFVMAPTDGDWLEVIESGLIATLELGPDAPPLGEG